jgi:hypothetical protein
MHKRRDVQRFPFPHSFPGFHTAEDFENAPPIQFAIDGFLQIGGVTLIAGLAGHGKTLIQLSIVKTLLERPGAKLWGHFGARETASRVLYLIPEATISPFKHRLELFRLLPFVQSGRLLVRTLSFDITTSLADPDITNAAKGAHVFLDSVIRFVEGQENDAADNQRGLAKHIFNLLGSGARSVVGAHHSPKTASKDKIMTLENVLRGSGDIGAIASSAWGIRQLDAKQNIIHVENVKARDFEPCGPFQIVGRPYIDTENDFRMHKKPGDCQSLCLERNKGGASSQSREDRARNIALMRRWLQENPRVTSKDLAQRFKKELSVELKESTVRRYRAEIQKVSA